MASKMGVIAQAVVSILFVFFLAGCFPMEKDPEFVSHDFAGRNVDRIYVLPLVDGRLVKDPEVDWEDRASLQKIFAGRLENRGYEVVVAPDFGSNFLSLGPEHIGAFREAPPWIKDLGPRGSRFVAVIVIESLEVVFLTGKAGIRGYMFDKATGELIWEHREDGKQSVGPILALLADDVALEYTASVLPLAMPEREEGEYAQPGVGSPVAAVETAPDESSAKISEGSSPVTSDQPDSGPERGSPSKSQATLIELLKNPPVGTKFTYECVGPYKIRKYELVSSESGILRWNIYVDGEKQWLEKPSWLRGLTLFSRRDRRDGKGVRHQTFRESDFAGYETLRRGARFSSNVGESHRKSTWTWSYRVVVGERKREENDLFGPIEVTTVNERRKVVGGSYASEFTATLSIEPRATLSWTYTDDKGSRTCRLTSIQ